MKTGEQAIIAGWVTSGHRVLDLASLFAGPIQGKGLYEGICW